MTAGVEVDHGILVYGPMCVVGCKCISRWGSNCALHRFSFVFKAISRFIVKSLGRTFEVQ